MRVAYIAHSLVALRQRLFATELGAQIAATGGQLREFYPAKWGNHSREGGYPVGDPGSLLSWHLPAKAYDDLEAFKPDVVLIQNEAYHRISHDMAQWCARRGIPYILFVWENAGVPDVLRLAAESVTMTAAHVVCGNPDAQRITESLGGRRYRTSIHPQVGFEPDLFPLRSPGHMPEFTLGFYGRADPMKGQDDLANAITGTPWTVLWGPKETYCAYESMARGRYWRAHATCTPSKDVHGRPFEQFSPGVNVESLFCGVPVVTTEQSAIRYWLRDATNVWFAKPADPESLRNTIRECLEESTLESNAVGRAWAIHEFGNQRVATDYIEIMEKCAQ